MAIEQIPSAVHTRLCKGAELMDIALQMSTGLRELDRKLVTYWTIATHMLPSIDTFPLLVLRGPIQTGKSQTLKIVSCFAHAPRKFTVGSSTFAVIRDEFSQSYEGTAVIEEADAAKDGNLQLERFLSDRYQRDSGQLLVKEKIGKDEWGSVSKRIFGATVLHRRVSFSDAALDGRSVSILYRNVKRDDYVESDKIEWMKDGYTNTADLSFKPIDIERPDDISSRIFNTYKPLLITAKVLGDHVFADDAREKMQVETDALYEAQSFEPDGLVVRAILATVNTSGWHNIKLGTIVDWIWTNSKVQFQPRQVGALVRSVGFSIKESHGCTVMIPTPARLLKACYDCGYSNDEELNELRQMVHGARASYMSWVDEVE